MEYHDPLTVSDELRLAVYVLAVLFAAGGAVNLALYGDTYGLLFLGVASLLAATALRQATNE